MSTGKLFMVALTIPVVVFVLALVCGIAIGVMPWPSCRCGIHSVDGI